MDIGPVTGTGRVFTGQKVAAEKPGDPTGKIASQRMLKAAHTEHKVRGTAAPIKGHNRIMQAMERPFAHIVGDARRGGD